MHSVSGAVGAGAPVSGAGGVGLGVGCAVGPPWLDGTTTGAGVDGTVYVGKGDAGLVGCS
mgnify:CR=1 FL=1